MTSLRILLHRLRALFRKQNLEQELDDRQNHEQYE